VPLEDSVKAVAGLPAALAAAFEPAPAAVPADWPGRDNSHGVLVAGLRWHVQWFDLAPANLAATDAASAVRRRPTVLLLHGTGASTHSWRGLLPHLLPHARVLVPDLPGHAGTERPSAASGLSLPGMASSLAALLQVLQLQPDLVVGHSAGAAIGARLCLDGGAAPHSLLSINGAWFPPQGVAGLWYAPMARLMASNPLAPPLLSWHSSQPAVLRRLLKGIGSPLDEQGQALYRRLARRADHVAAVIAMMAAWDLQPLLRDLPKLQPQLHLLAAQGDRAVPPAGAQTLRLHLPGAHVHPLPGLGHLAHEEAPERVAPLVLSLLAGDGARR